MFLQPEDHILNSGYSWQGIAVGWLKSVDIHVTVRYENIEEKLKIVG